MRKTSMNCNLLQSSEYHWRSLLLKVERYSEGQTSWSSARRLRAKEILVRFPVIHAFAVACFGIDIGYSTELFAIFHWYSRSSSAWYFTMPVSVASSCLHLLPLEMLRFHSSSPQVVRQAVVVTLSCLVTWQGNICPPSPALQDGLLPLPRPVCRERERERLLGVIHSYNSGQRSSVAPSASTHRPWQPWLCWEAEAVRNTPDMHFLSYLPPPPIYIFYIII